MNFINLLELRIYKVKNQNQVRKNVKFGLNKHYDFWSYKAILQVPQLAIKQFKLKSTKGCQTFSLTKIGSLASSWCEIQKIYSIVIWVLLVRSKNLSGRSLLWHPNIFPKRAYVWKNCFIVTPQCFFKEGICCKELLVLWFISWK
jgi:hypothetical protein